MGKNSKWRDEDIAEDIVNRLNDSKNTSKKFGRVTLSKVPGVEFNADGFNEYIDILVNNLRFDNKIPYRKREELVTEAIFVAAKRNILNRGAVQQFIKNLEKNYLTLSQKEYFLLTSLSIKYGSFLSKIIIDGSSISFLDRMPKNFKFDKEVNTQLKVVYDVKFPTNYTYIKVKVKAYCEEEAYQKAFLSLDFIRGIWNLTLNANTSRTSYSRPNPANSLVYGPLHTLHKKNGKMCSQFWGWQLENSFIHFPVENISRKYSILKNNEKTIRKLLYRNNEYTLFLKNSIIKYCRALDDSIMTTSFIKLWSVLEYLTISSNKGHDVTVSRASKIFGDKRFCKYILTTLRNKRNNIVHNGDNFDTAEQDLFMLNRHVNPILIFILNSSKILKCTKELETFYEMPQTKDELINKRNEHLKDLESIKLTEKLLGI
jgi:hypothetical protein